MSGASLDLRPATADDSRLLFGWANDPLTRKMARNPKPIAWGDHEVWLGRKLASADCRIWIAEAGGEPVGQIRLDRHGAAAEIDYSVAAGRRVEGWGKAILAALTADHAPGVAKAFGEARIENEASAKAFLAAGFEEQQETDVPDGYRRFAKELPDG